MSLEVTHIEIRRVQNGFVIQAVDYRKDHSMGITSPIQRASFVAQDVEALKALVESILAMAEVQWLPTADIPMLEMQRIVERDAQRGQAQSNEEMAKEILKQYSQMQAQQASQAVSIKKSPPPPIYPAKHY